MLKLIFLYNTGNTYAVKYFIEYTWYLKHSGTPELAFVLPLLPMRLYIRSVFTCTVLGRQSSTPAISVLT